MPGRTPGSLAGAALAAVLLSGCYQNTPLMSLPDPGAFVVLELNDQGRIGMVNNIGPDIARVEGILASRADSQFVVQVAGTFGLYGSQSRWSGEPVTFRPAYLRSLSERRFSPGRTATMAGVLASAVVGFVITRSIIGSGREGDTGNGGNGGQSNN